MTRKFICLRAKVTKRRCANTSWRKILKFHADQREIGLQICAVLMSKKKIANAAFYVNCSYAIYFSEKTN